MMARRSRPGHSVTPSPVIPHEYRRGQAQRLAHLEEASNLVQYVVEAAVPAGRQEIVCCRASIGKPRQPLRSSARPQRLRVASRGCSCAHAGDEGQSAGFAVRVELIDQCECILRGGGRGPASRRWGCGRGEVHVCIVGRCAVSTGSVRKCRRAAECARTDAELRGTLLVHYQSFMATYISVVLSASKCCRRLPPSEGATVRRRSSRSAHARGWR